MDIDGHPPIPLAQNSFSSLDFFLGQRTTPYGYRWTPTYSTSSRQFFSLVVFMNFCVQNFQGRFEALNDVFWRHHNLIIVECRKRQGKYLLLILTFPNRYQDLETKIKCIKYAPGKLKYQLTTTQPTNLLVFQIFQLQFWMFRIL